MAPAHFIRKQTLTTGERYITEELKVLEREYPRFRDDMTPEGRREAERQGLYVIDEEGDYTTPLIGDADCIYAYREGGVTLCAIEKAWRAGRTSFRKPVSCHLYPIRVTRFGDGSRVDSPSGKKRHSSSTNRSTAGRTVRSRSENPARKQCCSVPYRSSAARTPQSSRTRSLPV